MQEDKPLNGKTALVTGSTSGLGRHLAESLAAQGCAVGLNGFGEADEIAAFQKELEAAHGIRSFYHGADMTKPEEITGLVRQVEHELGGVDILVNNAGAQHAAPLEEFPDAKWEMLISLNLSAAFYTTKAVLPGMRARGWGRIVNIASAHGLVASALKAAYVASKHGLVGLTKVTALETAKDGITCNAICPGFILTKIVDGQIDAHAKAQGISRERVIEDVILAKHPNGKFIRPEDVAAYLDLLCSEAGATTTGAALSMDGGWTAT